MRDLLSMRFRAVVLFFTFWIACFASFAQPGNNISNMIKGYSALVGKATGPNYRLTKDGVVLLPATKNGARGFYVYDGGMAFFQALPSQPSNSNDRFNYHYLQLKLPGRSDLFLTYSDPVDESQDPGIAISKDPVADLKYHLAQPGESLDKAASDELKNELLKRIETVSSNYEKKIKSRRGVEVDQFRAALEVFTDIGDEALTSAAYAERRKLDSVEASAKSTEHTKKP